MLLINNHGGGMKGLKVKLGLKNGLGIKNLKLGESIIKLRTRLRMW